MQNNIITNILNFKDVEVNNYTENENEIILDVSMKKVEQICPKCRSKETKILAYRRQKVRDLKILNKQTSLSYKKARYECKKCHKTFFEDNPIVEKYQRRTSRFTDYLCEELTKLKSVKDICKENNISSGSVRPLIPYFCVTPTELPEIICIDEFKGNSGGQKYNVALLNGETHEIIDVLPSRNKEYLAQYFKKFSKEKRDKVKFVIGDLWNTYKDIAFTYFRKAKYVADRFHWYRCTSLALDSIRKKFLNKLPQKERKYLKNSKKLILAKKEKLSKESLEKLNFILDTYSEDLRKAYNLKEDLNKIMELENFDEKKMKFKELINDLEDSGIEELETVAKTYKNWYQPILNSLNTKYSNGPMEGTNNKIKVLKRITFGMRNFTNFKSRILLLNYRK